MLYSLADLRENMRSFSLELRKDLHHDLIDRHLHIIGIESAGEQMVGGRHTAKEILDNELSFFVTLLDLLGVDFEDSIEVGVLLEVLFVLQHIIAFGFVLCTVDFHAFVDLDLVG